MTHYLTFAYHVTQKQMQKPNFKQLVLATVVGCLVMFTWGGLSHLVIFEGTGFKPLPHEDHLMKTMKENISEPGLYLFPGIDFKNATVEQRTSWENKFKTGPAGMLVYRPVGGNPFSPGKLVVQFISNFISVLIVTLVASLLYTTYWGRVGIISLLGILTCSSVSTIYWNWYEYPTSFFMAQVLDMLIGFFLAGLVICRILKC
ncbi:MAG TPA: hypothetical protein VGK39_02525 [Cyclobacteriaceae bacterium]